MSETPTDRDNEYADIILRKNNQIKKQQEEIAHLKAKNKELEEKVKTWQEIANRQIDTQSMRNMTSTR